jgi:hypothetical protein
MVGYPLEGSVREDEVLRNRRLPTGKVCLDPGHVRVRRASAFEHCGRVVDADDTGSGPALCEQAGAVPWPATEIHGGPHLAKVDPG